MVIPIEYDGTVILTTLSLAAKYSWPSEGGLGPQQPSG